METRVTKIFRFEAAHRLSKHSGLCKNIHGHSYKVEVTLQKGLTTVKGLRSEPSLNANDMVIDFKDVSNVVGRFINEQWDHALLLNEDDELFQQAINVEKEYFRLFTFKIDPTAEAMANYLMTFVDGRFFDRGIYVVNIKVWETETSYAEVRCLS